MTRGPVMSWLKVSLQSLGPIGFMIFVMICEHCEPSFIVSLVMPIYTPTCLVHFNHSIQRSIGLYRCFLTSHPTCSMFFWRFVPRLEGPTTALPSGPRDPESQARTHRVARESRSWTRLGMTLVVRRAPHLDEEIWYTPLGSIRPKIRYHDELDIKGKLREHVFPVWKDEQAIYWSYCVFVLFCC